MLGDKLVEQEVQQRKGSYHDVVSEPKIKSMVNFRYVEPSSDLEEGVDVAIPLASVREASERYGHTLYGYFLGNRVAFPVVQNYVRNVWGKYGLEKIMMNLKGFFFFKFTTEQGMLDVMENGPRIIRTIPMILNKWMPKASLTKEDLSKVPVWVKIHDVSLSGFTEDGLSCIASRIGKPMMLDSYTSTMCMDSWGRPNYARALIEVHAKQELKESLVVATPSLDGKTQAKDEVKIEYEWRPPRCAYCEVFGHLESNCPKVIPIKETKPMDNTNGFKQVTKKKAKGVTIGTKPNAEGNMGGEKESNDPDVQQEPPMKIGDHAKGNNVTVGDLVDEESDVEEDQGGNGDRYKGQALPVKMVIMFSIALWNIRGLNIFPKQNEVRDVITSNNLCICAILESRVSLNKLKRIGDRVFHSWDWTSNSNVCDGGTHIFWGWDPAIVQVTVLAVTDQVTHCKIRVVNDGTQFFISFVYADNYYIRKRILWRDLEMHANFIGNHPWDLLGDFNVSLSIDESTAVGSCMTLAMREFMNCLNNIQASDINNMGMQFTWNQKPHAKSGILKKIDRVLGNDAFLSGFVNAYALFQPYRISDHCPSILEIPGHTQNKPNMFRFSNYITDQEGFKAAVHAGWNVDIEGYSMFCLVKKLRGLKKLMRKLMWEKGHIHATVKRLRSELDKLQMELDKDPESRVIREAEADKLKEYNDAVWDEERFLKQKLKIQWLKAGDSNTSYFYKVIKGRANRSRINAIMDRNGILIEGSGVVDCFVQHYMSFLGTDQQCVPLDNLEDLFLNKLSSSKENVMVRPITEEEVKATIFDIGEDKSPGTDGYSSAFFKKAWDIVGQDVCKAVMDFFRNGQLLTKINHTVLAMLPKVETPSMVNDYSPISCCNVIYKCISKIITARIKGSLNDIVSDNQSTFVPSRRITDNILITQEIMKNYHLDRGVPRCAFKVDIQKDYDTVDWRVGSKSPEEYNFFLGCIKGFEELNPFIDIVCGRLVTIRYLGVPLVSSRLYHKDCKSLVDGVKAKIGDWKNKFLSYAGRRSRNFFWYQGEMKKEKAKVKWKDVCLPKNEGGLGIKSLKTYNVALMAYHVWCLITRKQSLWVRWIHSYRLVDKSFWEVDIPATASYSWRKILNKRGMIRPFIIHKVGNGANTSAWYDSWIDYDNLSEFISHREIVRAGFSNVSRVAELIFNNAWKWPVPRHSFILWLLVLEKLKTQDKLKPWEVNASTASNVCVLCKAHQESHDHLFFECPYSKHVWSLVARVVVSKILFSASVYFIWQERKSRLFNNVGRNPDQLVKAIVSTVRLKMLSLKFKDSHHSHGDEAFKLPSGFEVVVGNKLGGIAAVTSPYRLEICTLTYDCKIQSHVIV
ncbi:uncharacterized protein [Rutidosis leptorrhynchoides]|uniref:uncharacterized protein n=1 Tax=Rutidosis leptorrhynchoides TaxID=125765 RepID=UPI003A9A09F1